MANGSGSAGKGGRGGINRKARDGSIYDGFGGAGITSVDHHGKRPAGNTTTAKTTNAGVMRGKKSVYGGFDEDEEV